MSSYYASTSISSTGEISYHTYSYSNIYQEQKPKPEIADIIVIKLKDGCYKEVYGDIVRYFDKNGKYHREDGPAYIELNCEVWYKHGEKHREDGPAYKYSNGKIVEKYYLNGIQCKEHEVKIKRMASTKDIDDILDSITGV